MMEDLILTCEEHKILKRFQKRLQNRYNVEIHMPDTVASTESDIIFASINGEKHNIENVKKFLQEKTSRSKETAKCTENVITITLSDSEEETSSSESDESSGLDELSSAKIPSEYFEKSSSSNIKEESSSSEMKENSVLLLDELTCPKVSSKYVGESNLSSLEEETSNSEFKENSVLILDEVPHPEVSSQFGNNSSLRNPLEDSVCVIELPKNFTETGRFVQYAGEKCSRKRKLNERRQKNKKVRSNGIPSLREVEVCEVSSTTEDVVSEKKTCASKKVPEFIPLSAKQKRFKSAKDVPNNTSKKQEESDVVVLKDPLPAVGPLRPIVIDGSNVAIEHGKVSHTFSVKGIKLAVDYFLDRGHTQVTAFVPKFRRIPNPRQNYPTTDGELLDELAKKQLVVFTPSRRVNGKNIASYDDRFIVDLASQNGGIIVSNDNYRDLVEESDSFKEAIEKRLLMFCFVGDIFMIPSDPLGRNGPPLKEFLSFPPDEKT